MSRVPGVDRTRHGVEHGPDPASAHASLSDGHGVSGRNDPELWLDFRQLRPRPLLGGEAVSLSLGLRRSSTMTS